MSYERLIERAAGSLANALFHVPVTALIMHAWGPVAVACLAGGCLVSSLIDAHRAWKVREGQ